MKSGKALFVYVAGPYTAGDCGVNLRNASLAGQELLDFGLVPFVPHLCHLWHLVSPNEYDVWLAWCLSWVTKCDALIRLPGKSPGADKEEATAKTLGIPVFYSVKELKKWAKKQ